MKISDIQLEMELYGVDSEDITEILEICKSKAYDTQAIDKELQKRGYEPLFTLEYEEDDSESLKFEKEYLTIFRLLQKTNPDIFCDLFNQSKVSFKFFENLHIKKMYCDKCQQK